MVLRKAFAATFIKKTFCGRHRSSRRASRRHSRSRSASGSPRLTYAQWAAVHAAASGEGAAAWPAQDTWQAAPSEPGHGSSEPGHGWQRPHRHAAAGGYGAAAWPADANDVFLLPATARKDTGKDIFSLYDGRPGKWRMLGPDALLARNGRKARREREG